MQTSSTLKKYEPKSMNWFENEIIYEGNASAVFDNPKGIVLGKGKITIDQFGKINAEMKVENIRAKGSVKGRNIQTKINNLIYRPMKGIGRTGVIWSDGNKNSCSQLTIKTKDGIFTSKGKINWTAIDPDDNIIFWFSNGVFVTKASNKPKFWVAPLINFVCDFPSNNHAALIKHPLRLYLTPKIPKNEKNKVAAFLSANRKNHLIGFNFSEGIGYIEPLPDYYEKKKELEEGKKRKSLTALMVGEITNSIDTYWFPHDYAKLLTVATGSEVQAAWLEYRNAKGKLISRKHFPSLDVCYTSGYAAVKENTGKLISLASNFNEFNDTYFSVFTNQLAHLTSTSHFENRMMILTRTFEGLYEYLNKGEKLGQKSLMAKLPDSVKNEVNQIMRGAQKDIRKLSRKARSEGISEEISFSLERIADRINANNKDDDFGVKVIRILDWFELPDSKIMGKYYQEKKNKSWAGYLSQMRNNPIHDGYFSLQDGKHNSDEIITFQDHLHDILIRIFLKILKYDEDYSPKVKDRYVIKKVSWVTEKTSAIDLGYERIRGFD